MDRLYQLFAASFDPNPNLRKSAELEIKSLESQAGMLTSVFQLSTSSQAEIALRQASSIYLKNRIFHSWTPPPTSKESRLLNLASSSPPIPDSDKDFIRNSIIQSLIHSPRQVAIHLASAFGSIVRYDYPNVWNRELIQQLGDLLSDNAEGQEPDAKRVAGLKATLELVKSFRWNQDEKILSSMLNPLLPVILSLGQKLISLPAPTSSCEAVGHQLHLITKIYKTSLSSVLISEMQQDSSIMPWGQFLISVASFKLDQSVTDPWEQDDEEEREQQEWFKAKKWSTFALNRLFSKYGNPSQLPPSSSSYKPFAERFVSVFAPEILRIYLGQIEAYVSCLDSAKAQALEIGQIKAGWLGRKVRVMICAFLTECVKPKSTWLLLKPHVDLLIQKFILPSMCFSTEDLETWTDSPTEFIRNQFDALEETSSIQGSSANFLTTVCNKRNKVVFLPQLDFITSIMNSYQQNGGKNVSEKEGALHMVNALSVAMLNSDHVKNMLEAFFSQHVIPELVSQNKLLRFRSLELIRSFGNKMAWRDEKNLEATFKGVMSCLDDSELPIKVQAAEALSVLIDHDVVQASMAPNAGRLMQELLKLSDEIDLDVLTQAKEKIVANFSEELLPFAVEITTHMTNSFLRLAREHVASVNDESDANVQTAISLASAQEEDKLFAALGCLNTIYQVLSIAEDKPEVLAQLESLILPVVNFTVENNCIELYDDAFDLTDMLTFYQKRISEPMWNTFLLMYNSFKNSDGIDFLSEMLPTFDNVISFGSEIFKQNPGNRSILVDIFNTAMTSDQLGAGDHIAACKLADVFLLVLKGSMDEAIPGIMGTLLPLVIKGKKTPAGVKKWAMICLLDSIYYSVPLSLQVLESSGSTTAFFTVALQSLDKLTRVHEKKVAIVSFLSILASDQNSLPESVKSGLPQILVGLIQSLKTLPEAMKKRRETTEAFQSGDLDVEDEDDAADFAADYDDNDIQDKDNEYLEILAQEGKRLREAAAARAARNGADADDEDFEDDFEDDDDEEDEEPVYESPLDSIRVFDLFRSVMGDLQNNQPALFQALTSSLSPEQQSDLQAASSQSDELPPKNDVPGLPTQ